MQASFSCKTPHGGCWNKCHRNSQKCRITHLSFFFQKCRLDRIGPFELRNLLAGLKSNFNSEDRVKNGPIFLVPYARSDHQSSAFSLGEGLRKIYTRRKTGGFLRKRRLPSWILQLINFTDRCRFRSIFIDVWIYISFQKFRRSAEIGTISELLAYGCHSPIY